MKWLTFYSTSRNMLHSHLTPEVSLPTTNEVRSLTEIAFHWLLFGGEQLTAKRARGVRIRNNSTNSADRLEGLLPIAEDWHAKVVFWR